MDRLRTTATCAADWVARWRAPSIPDDARSRLARRLDDDSGQTLAEYALILALIAILAVVALAFLGDVISDLVFSTIGGAMEEVVDLITP